MEALYEQKKIGRNMTYLRCTLISICLLPGLATAFGQPVTGKPVLSAPPSSGKRVTSGAQTSGPPAVSSSNYVIGADDTIQITVWNEPNLSVSSLPVRPDGMISLPLIDEIVAAGLTPLQLKADITERLSKFKTDPVVDVNVLSVGSKRIFFVGEVGRQGPMPISSGMTILQAIATAGLTPYAKKKSIYILRNDSGRQLKIPFDYSKALKKGDMQGVSLVPGDTIVVP